MIESDTNRPLSYYEPQPVTHSPGRYALFIVLSIAEDSRAYDVIRAACGDFSSILRSIRVREEQKSLQCIIGFGSNAWNGLFGNPRPANLHPFKALQGNKHTAPSTSGDIFLHIRGDNMAVCFEFARQIMNVFGDAVRIVDEVHAFRYLDGRSMVGFVDGTENPVDLEALEYAVIGDEDPAFKGGSYAIAQKYIHNMAAWENTPTAEQEKIIGRTKYDDIELDDNTKPINAHNAVTNITDENGNELKIVRANLPFGKPGSGEFGTYFIGYARHVSTTEKMLENMFIGDPVGNYDRLLDFSTAVTGGLFFIPSTGLLASLVEREPQAISAESAQNTSAPPTEKAHKNPDGSFNVGSLKNSI
ncbi:MAG: Dyp-type peroxidase [Saezia sp.]